MMGTSVSSTIIALIQLTRKMVAVVINLPYGSKSFSVGINGHGTQN